MEKRACKKKKERKGPVKKKKREYVKVPYFGGSSGLRLLWRCEDCILYTEPCAGRGSTGHKSKVGREYWVCIHMSALRGFEPWQVIHSLATGKLRPREESVA